MLGGTIPLLKTPMNDQYHPEIDESPVLEPKEATKFRAILGSAQWMVTLGRFDIAYTVQALSRFGVQPRTNHLHAARRMLGYLKRFPDDKVIIDTNKFDHGIDSFQEKPPKYQKVEDPKIWKNFYPEGKEELPHNQPTPKGSRVKVTCFVDADHARDKATRKSITGILLFINNTPVRWISKRQTTVETSTYGSELVAFRMATDTIVEYRYKLRMLGVELDGATDLFGDNMSVVLNVSLPASALKKKHQSLAYHRVCEAVAASILAIAHVNSSQNYADLMTKPLPSNSHWALTQKLLRRKPITHELAEKQCDGKPCEIPK